MADDAADPRSSFYKSLHRIVAKFTHVLDDNIRIVQYGIYGVGVAGLLVALHSVRAFTRFGQIGQIPGEFVTKHVRLHGYVRWVGTVPPPPLATATTKSPQPPPELLPPPPSLTQEDPSTPAVGNMPSSSPSATLTRTTTSTSATTSSPLKTPEGGEVLREEAAPGASLPEAPKKDVSESWTAKGLTPLNPWEDTGEPEVARIHYSEELTPLYLQVEHSPIVRLPWGKENDECLPIQLADIEVTGMGALKAKEDLHSRRIWFTLLKRDLENDTLVCFVRRNGLLRRRFFNEELVRSGEAIVAPLDLELHDDAFYVAFYKRLLDGQTFAEKKKVGLWRPEATGQRKGLLTKVWRKIRSLVSSKKDSGSS